MITMVNDRKAYNKSVRDLISKKFVEQIVSWYAKIDFLKQQLSVLEKLKTFPIIRIATFLLKCQLIEFELKQLIFTLDEHLLENNQSRILKRKVKTPKQLDDSKITLGGLAKELSNYDGALLKILLRDLNNLVSIRNNFTHRLFDNRFTTNDLLQDSGKAIPLANKILEEIKNADFAITGMKNRTFQ